SHQPAVDPFPTRRSSDLGGGDVFKATNIVEEIDIGAPVDVVYNQWTQYEDFPDFMKKVENVEQEEDTKTKWRAQILWSHRQWERSEEHTLNSSHVKISYA